MFERFTDRARRTVALAQQEARMLNHNYIGTEHVLLGLIHEGEGLAAQALKSMDISLENVREKIENVIGQGQQAPSGHIPFTPRAKMVLELSLREALQLGHNYIGTEHILLGLLREGEGVAAQVLVALGAELTAVRQAVIQLLSGPPAREAELAILEGQIAETRRQKASAIDEKDFDKAAILRDHEKKLVTEWNRIAPKPKKDEDEGVSAKLTVEVPPKAMNTENLILGIIEVTEILMNHQATATPALVAALLDWKQE